MNPKQKNLLRTIVVFLLLLGAFWAGQWYESGKAMDLLNAKPMNFVEESESDLQYKAFVDCDEKAYDRLTILYLDYQPSAFLPIALQMAGNDFAPACYDVYSTVLSMELLSEDGNSLSEWQKMPLNLQRFALDYLLKSAELGNDQAIEELQDYFLPGKKLGDLLLAHKDLTTHYSKLIRRIGAK